MVVLGFANIDNTVDVERNLLAVGPPMLVAEAVVVLSVGASDNRVVAVGDGLFVDDVLAIGVGDLSTAKKRQ